MTIETDYAKHADGSINYAYYDQRARQLRSEAAWATIDEVSETVGELATPKVKPNIWFRLFGWRRVVSS